MNGVLRLCVHVGRVYRDIERQGNQVPEQPQRTLKALLNRTQRDTVAKTERQTLAVCIHVPKVECISRGKAESRMYLASKYRF